MKKLSLFMLSLCLLAGSASFAAADDGGLRRRGGGAAGAAAAGGGGGLLEDDKDDACTHEDVRCCGKVCALVACPIATYAVVWPLLLELGHQVMCTWAPNGDGC